MLCFYLVQQSLNPSDCLANVPMVPLTDMPCQITERCRCPVCFVGIYVFAVFMQPVQDFFSRNICMQARIMQRFPATAAVVQPGIFENLPGRWIRKRNILHLGFTIEIHNYLRDSS